MTTKQELYNKQKNCSVSKYLNINNTVYTKAYQCMCLYIHRIINVS